ncbi:MULTISPECIES: OsmC family protein [Pseudoalteromonas]|uniref:OsmC family protein n=1 Tax=Pseudoalteromonas obscura TaxID=3048491 RepID=A0ABT7EQ30_9GAMM|nr:MULTISPECIES: OsmC family protein [Pseudoalteromonas]MBQ4839457.1 OsmC family protein [Pseudoalteromonas luteoviolacea]MDK2597103.1 OsmC family protein [Pseudoalteromonas sp. P94(2023)]
MKASVKWVGGDTFLGLSNSGHNVVFDAGADSAAPSPMEMVLMSAGSCASVDVVSILKKAKQSVQSVEVQLTAQRADSAPRVFTKINLHFVVTGDNVSEKHLARAVNLSAEKYCSVALMLEKAVEITHTHEVVQGG